MTHPAMLPSVTYRRATSADSHCLYVLATQVFLDTYATNGINADLANEVRRVLSELAFSERLVSSTVELFVAERNGYLIGFIDLDFDSVPPLTAPKGVEVLRLYVQQPFQRIGIGKALMALAEARARVHGRSDVWLTAWVGNDNARAFYRALGFLDLGRTEYVIEGVGYENRVFSKALPEV